MFTLAGESQSKSQALRLSFVAVLTYIRTGANMAPSKTSGSAKVLALRFFLVAVLTERVELEHVYGATPIGRAVRRAAQQSNRVI